MGEVRCIIDRKSTRWSDIIADVPAGVGVVVFIRSSTMSLTTLILCRIVLKYMI